MPEITIRDAVPDTADVAAVAWDLETATDRMFSLLLGSRWESVLRSVIAQPGHAWSVGRARVAEIDGTLAGVLLGAPASVAEPDLTREVGHGWTRLRLAGVGLACQPFLSFMSRHHPDEWYITAVSVKPEARGQGVAAALLRDAIARARSAGMSSITLDMDTKNATAHRLYLREGFTVTGTSPPALLVGAVRVHRMQRPLRADPAGG